MFTVIEGGLLTAEKNIKKHFVSAYVTDTRLMGVLAIYVHWKRNIPDALSMDDENNDIHQFFYIDCEEMGLETYKSIIGNDREEIDLVEQALVGGLGARKINLTERQLRGLLTYYKKFNKHHGLPLPQNYDEYGFILDEDIILSEDEQEHLMFLICSEISSDYQVVNYFLMRLFGRDYTDPGVRVRVGALIENAGCFPGSSVYQNLMMQCINLGIENPDEEIRRVLEIVRMEDSANIKFKSCSLGMKQRIGIAMALLGDPALLILDEPINGLDTDGMRIMREILVDITQKYGCTVLISSHILGELEKIATHYGIIRQGRMVMEMSAKDLEGRARVFTSLRTKDMKGAKDILKKKFSDVRTEGEYIRVYDVDDTESIVEHLLKNGHIVSEIRKNKIGLEEYYIELMSGKEEK